MDVPDLYNLFSYSKFSFGYNILVNLCFINFSLWEQRLCYLLLQLFVFLFSGIFDVYISQYRVQKVFCFFGLSNNDFQVLLDSPLNFILLSVSHKLIQQLFLLVHFNLNHLLNSILLHLFRRQFNPTGNDLSFLTWFGGFDDFFYLHMSFWLC